MYVRMYKCSRILPAHVYKALLSFVRSIYVCMYVCMYVCISSCPCLSVYKHTEYTHVCMNNCMYIHMCSYIYILDMRYVCVMYLISTAHLFVWWLNKFVRPCIKKTIGMFGGGEFGRVEVIHYFDLT